MSLIRENCNEVIVSSERCCSITPEDINPNAQSLANAAPAIQEAINLIDSSGGGKVEICGTYKTTETIFLPQGVYLEGCSEEWSRIEGNVPGGPVIEMVGTTTSDARYAGGIERITVQIDAATGGGILVDGGQRFRAESFVVDSNGTTASPSGDYGVWLKGADTGQLGAFFNQFEHGEIRGIDGPAILLTQGATATTWRANRNNFQNILCQSCRQGIVIDDVDTNTFDYVHMQDIIEEAILFTNGAKYNTVSQSHLEFVGTNLVFTNGANNNSVTTSNFQNTAPIIDNGPCFRNRYEEPDRLILNQEYHFGHVFSKRVTQYPGASGSIQINTCDSPVHEFDLTGDLQISFNNSANMLIGYHYEYRLIFNQTSGGNHTVTLPGKWSGGGTTNLATPAGTCTVVDIMTTGSAGPWVKILHNI